MRKKFSWKSSEKFSFDLTDQKGTTQDSSTFGYGLEFSFSSTLTEQNLSLKLGIASFIKDITEFFDENG